MSTIHIYFGFYMFWIVFLFLAYFLRKNRRQAEIDERVMRAANLQFVNNITRTYTQRRNQVEMNQLVYCELTRESGDSSPQSTLPDIILFIPVTDDLPPPYTDIEAAPPSYEDCLRNL